MSAASLLHNRYDKESQWMEPIAKILEMVVYSFSHTFEGVRITENPTDFRINCPKL